MTPEQTERIAVFLRSSVGQDFKQMLAERRTGLVASLLSADDHVRMFRAQGRASELQDIIDLLTAIERVQSIP